MVDLPGLDALARIVDPVARRFSTAGHRLYLVGGVVRDLVLAGDEPFDPAANDIDLTTDALPGEIKELVAPLADAIWTQGERFGTIGVMVGGQPLEITTHRAEAYDPESRKPIVTFGRELEEDLSRRDFTVNAMAIELPARRLRDPYHGRRDLAAGLLRTPLSPEISFTDDPLRIMRAARFVARLSLDPGPELLDAAARLSERLEIVSVERVADELERLLAVDEPAEGLAFLAATGALGHIVHPYGPEGGRQPARVELAVRLGSWPAEPVVRRAGLLWPLRPDVRPVLSRLRYAKADQLDTARLVEAVATGLSPDLSRPAARRLVASVGLERLPSVSALAAAVEHHDPAVAPGSAQRLDDLLADLTRGEDLADVAPVLDGIEIIELLGLEPGPDVGRALTFLTEYRLDNGPLEPDQARELLLAWWREVADGN